MKLIIIVAASVLGSMHAYAQHNPVIVELFTSQGCSSCPSADANLTAILEKAAHDGNPVIGLSFHVDYWNYIGWKDPYSNKAFTARQRAYAEVMNLSSVYTPQMVINGAYELIGSDRRQSADAITKAAEQKPVYQIQITNYERKDGVVRFHYVLDKASQGELINIAIVERSVENYVPRGENTGRKLHHDNVVRTFITQALKQESDVEIEIAELNTENASLILYIQNKRMVMVGATMRSL